MNEQLASSKNRDRGMHAFPGVPCHPWLNIDIQQGMSMHKLIEPNTTINLLSHAHAHTSKHACSHAHACAQHTRTHIYVNLLVKGLQDLRAQVPHCPSPQCLTDLSAYASTTLCCKSTNHAILHQSMCYLHLKLVSHSFPSHWSMCYLPH